MPPTDLVRRDARLGLMHRVRSSQTYDPDNRTVEIVAATDTPVRMPGWRLGLDTDYLEILDMSPSAVDLSSVEARNCPLLDSHNRWSLQSRLGAVTAAQLSGRELIVVGSFGESDAARQAEAEMTSAAPPPVSSGYRVEQMQFERFEGDLPVYRATRWKLTEVSFVPIAADPNAGVRADSGLHPCIIMESRAMPPEQTPAAGTSADNQPAAPAAESTRAAPAAPAAAPVAAPTPVATPEPVGLRAAEALQLQDQARALGVEQAVRSALDDPNATRASVSDAILAAAAGRQGGNQTPLPAGAGARDSGSDITNRNDGIRGAMLHSLRSASGVASEPAAVSQPYLRHSISELAAVVLGEREMPRSAADRVELFARAFHSTSDFPILLGGAMNTRLQETYQSAQPIYRRIAQQMTFADFRAHEILRPGDFPTLKPIGETGEIKFGTFGEKKESVTVGSYGIQFGLSRQLLVNDHLGAIDRILANQGTAVGLFEEFTFFAMKAAANGLGPVLLEDGKTVFHADHGNRAGTGTAITEAALSAGRAALRKQKNLSGVQMGLPPAILLVSPDKETEAEKAVGARPNGEFNPFQGKLHVEVGGQLSGNAWELYADQAFGSNWTWGLLDGFTAPRLTVETKFGQQGVAVSLEHDFGCGAQDFRYGYRNGGE